MARALVVLTSHATLGSTGRPTGWYLPEVTHVYWPLVDAGIDVDFASPSGGAAPMDPGSRKLEDPHNKRFLDDPAATAKVAATLRPDQVDPRAYDLVFFAGGHGTMWDFRSPELARVTAGIYEAGGIVAAVCHGPAALVDVRLSDGRWLVDGKRLTAFTDDEERAVELTGVVPFPLEATLRERGAKIEAGPRWSDTVVVDGRLLTGQNPQSALQLGRKAAELVRARP